MKLADAPGWASELLEGGRVGHLGLLDEDDLPRVQPVTFALVGERLWSAIDAKPKRAGVPARVARLRRRPEAALTIDRYEEDWASLAWVQALGRVEVIEAGERPDVLERLAAKYPQYRDDPPPGPLLGLRIERILCWRAAGD